MLLLLLLLVQQECLIAMHKVQPTLEVCILLQYKSSSYESYYTHHNMHSYQTTSSQYIWILRARRVLLYQLLARVVLLYAYSIHTYICMHSTMHFSIIFASTTASTTRQQYQSSKYYILMIIIRAYDSYLVRIYTNTLEQQYAHQRVASSIICILYYQLV